MEQAGAAQEWEYPHYEYNFDVDLPKHIRRAWERVPKSPHTARHKGRKVWKRPEIKAPPGEETIASDQNRVALTELSTNTPRVVKKLRLKDGMNVELRPKVNNFHATLRETNIATPKRKQRTVTGDAARSQTTSAACDVASLASQASEPEQAPTDLQPASTNSPPVKSNEATHSVSADIDAPTSLAGGPLSGSQASADNLLGFSLQEQSERLDQTSVVNDGSPAKSLQESRSLVSPSKQRGRPRKYPQSPRPGMPNGNKQTPSSIRKHTFESLPMDVNVSPSRSSRKENSASPRKTPGRPRKRPVSPLPATTEKESEAALPCNEDISKTPKDLTQHQLTEGPPSASKQTSTVTVDTPSAKTPQPKDAAIGAHPTPTPNLLSLDSPQIGTTLLRRESLRRRGSPSKRQSTKRGRTPQKKQLKKRDTLQEREILQKFSEGEHLQEGDIQNVAEKAAGQDQNSTTTSTDPKEEPTAPDDSKDELIESEAVQAAACLTLNEQAMDDASVAIEELGGSEEIETDIAPTESATDPHTLDGKTEAISQPELAGVEPGTTDIGEEVELPTRKTRSTARFSDDTSVLKDFLSRAQASKAAKTTLSPGIVQPCEASPQRSPRKRKGGAVAEKTHGSSAEKIIQKQVTSPAKAKLELTFGDDLEEEAAVEPEPEPVITRRSTRSRLPAPPKTPQNVPSLIPVRRSDGADPLVLQKTQAQELALATRTNTRRNKGQARPPLLALKDLPVDNTEVLCTEKLTTSKGKAVAWAENIASYQEGKEVADEIEEQRPKVRRMRLGGGNGTPAAKKKAGPAAPSNSTPAPKRRGKSAG